MCKSILSFAVLLFFISCGNKQTSTSSNEQTNNSASADNMLAEKMDRGKAIYDKTCTVCHQATGAGVPKSFPPLASSDYLNADVNKVIDGLLFGNKGEMVVNGETYNNVMPPQVLTDEEISYVLTYVYNSWQNSAKEVTPEMVAQRRASNQ
ncbi:MAG: cytochrome c [Saprospiraceae bacterium]|jgi:nitrite reductase (NO-forming)|nr:cytochrome c [Saprospiraceae bacterium]